MASDPDGHAHCWHQAYVGMGDWITVCCHCGVSYFPTDFRSPHLPQPHGPYADNPRVATGELRRRVLTDREVFALTGMVRRAPDDARESRHTHAITWGGHDGE